MTNYKNIALNQKLIISLILAFPVACLILFYASAILYAMIAWAIHEGPLVVAKSLLGIY